MSSRFTFCGHEDTHYFMSFLLSFNSYRVFHLFFSLLLLLLPLLAFSFYSSNLYKLLYSFTLASHCSSECDRRQGCSCFASTNLYLVSRSLFTYTCFVYFTLLFTRLQISKGENRERTTFVSMCVSVCVCVRARKKQSVVFLDVNL